MEVLMRDFLLTICPYAIWSIAAAELLIAIMLLRLKKRPIVICSVLVTFGLILDAVIIGLGAFLPESVLAAISPVRFVAHGILIPLLFPICGYALKLKKPVMVGVWVFTVLLMIAGAAEGIATVLEPKKIAGVVRYASSENTPGWADIISRILSFGTVIPMMIAGIVVWVKQKTPHLFLSGFFMFAFSALGPATGNSDLIFFISMFGELLMVLFLYLYCRRKQA
jgi:hypothetical protein